MEMGESDFRSNITTHPKIMQRWKDRLSKEDFEKFRRIKFAFGTIEGTFGKDGSLKGPNNETAKSDMHAVFYRRGGELVTPSFTGYVITLRRPREESWAQEGLHWPEGLWFMP